MFFTFFVNLPLICVEEHLKTVIISWVIHNLRKVWNSYFFTMSSLEIDKNTSSLSCFMHNFDVVYLIYKEKFEYVYCQY